MRFLIKILSACLLFVRLVPADEVPIQDPDRLTQELLAIQPITEQSQDFTALINLVPKGEGKLARTVVVQKSNNTVVMMIVGWNDCPLFYAHDGVLYSVSALHPGSLEVCKNTKFDISFKLNSGPKCDYSFSPITDGEVPAKVGVDIGEILHGAASARISSTSDPGSRCWTIRTQHSLVTAQTLPATSQIGGTSFCSVSTVALRMWVLVVSGKQVGLSLPTAWVKDGASFLVDGNTDSIKAFIEASDNGSLWKDRDFPDSYRLLRKITHSGSWILETTALEEIQALNTARVLALATSDDPAVRAKTNALLDHRIKNISGQIVDSDSQSDDDRKRLGVIYGEADLSGDMAKILPANSFAAFAKSYLAYPTATTRLTGERVHFYNLLCDAEAIGIPADKLVVIASAATTASIREDQLADQVWHQYLMLRDFGPKNALIASDFESVLKSNLTDEQWKDVIDRESRRPALDRFSGLEDLQTK